MLFSIIVPVYNIEKYVSQCIESILAQTYQDFELILVDDGSTDSSGKICDEYAQRDSRIIVIHKENGGQTSARKTALNRVQGEYIVPIDGDDWVSENLLQKAQDIFNRHQNIDIICYGYYQATKREKVAGHNSVVGGYYNKERLKKEIYPRLLRGESGKRFSPNIWGKFLKKDLYIQYQNMIDTRIKIGEDECVVFPCVYNANAIYVLEERLYFYRQNENSITQTRKKGYPWQDIRLRKEWHERTLPMNEYNFQNQLNRLIVHELFTYAKSHLRSGRPYREIKREIIEEFSREEYQQAIKNCFYKKNWKEKLALFSVRHKTIFLIYLYAKME